MTAPKTDSPPAEKKKKLKFNPYPWYSPRFWHGMRVRTWFGLLARNRYKIYPTKWPMAGLITAFAFFNSGMRQVQQTVYGRRIAATPLEHDPIFIIGHWRSGTTFLHELLSNDERFFTPTTYECFASNHFVLTEDLLSRMFWFIMPRQRPMDNVKMGWNQPQEDEFALVNLGIPSPYLRIAFPLEPPVFLEYLDMQGLDEPALCAWEVALQQFLRELTFHRGRQIVLKSPTHTGRLETLDRLYPRAKFIHIVRDPKSLVPSTIRLWQSLDLPQGLQPARCDYLEDYVFDCYRRMYAGFNRYRERLGPERIYDLRYEDLVADPVARLEDIYRQLQLGDFQLVRPKIEQFAREKSDYQTNRHELPPPLAERIREVWADYIERYGYGEE